MTERELRQLVRDAISRQLAQTGTGTSFSAALAEAGEVSPARRSLVSFTQFAVPSGPDGTCVIEPSVMCNHCGYCKSYGH
jgi:hypothetical protein